jgi:antitoxin ParD1/3/4
VVRSGLRLLEDQEQKITALRTAIEEGITSGCVEDFDSKAYLQEMKARKHGKI